MAVLEYNIDRNPEIVACIIDNTMQSYSPWAKEIIKNISDQSLLILSAQFSVIIGDDENELIEYARKHQYKKIILAPTGIDIINFHFIEKMPDQEIIDLRNHLQGIDLSFVDGTDPIKFNKEMPWQYKKFIASLSFLFYATSNDPYINFEMDKIHQMITTASGFIWAHYLIKHGFDNTTVVKFVDCNFFALECMKEIIQWDGKDYPKFLKEMGQRRYSFLGFKWNERIKNIHTVEEDWEIFLKDHPNWEADWQSIKSSVKFEFHMADFYDINLNVAEWISNVDNTFINLSNVFNYTPTASFHTIENKLISENSLIEKLKNYCPNATVYFHARIPGCFGVNARHLGKAAEFETHHITEFKTPTWRENEWI